MGNSYQLEYTGEGEIEVSGVGRFGARRFNRKKKKHEKIKMLPCSKEIGTEFLGHPLFKVHGIKAGGQGSGAGGRKTETRTKKKEVG